MGTNVHRSLARWVRAGLRSAAVLFAVAFLARLGNLHIAEILGAPGPDHLAFGYEVGRIARSLVEGHGFSSPFVYDTGPTAWLGPVYPLLMAACFKVFGVYSAASAIAILSLNSLFAALTCLLVRLIARETVGETPGLIAAWFLAVAPFEINFATRLIWDTSLSALLLAAVFLLTLRMKHAEGALRWSGYGIVWGLIALTNPSLLSFLPVAFFRLWCPKEAGRRSRLALAALVFALTLVPWTLRNYRALHEFVPLRDNLAMELYLGNHDGAEGFAMTGDHPVWNGREMGAYATQGEIAYLAGKMDAFKAFVREDPGRFLELTLKRVLIFWAWGPSMGGGPPVPALRRSVRNGLYFLSSLGTIGGLVLVIRRRMRGAFLYAGLIALYPLVYYVTHNNPRYRHPIEPVMALLAAYLVHTAVRRPFQTPSREKSPVQALSVASISNTETGVSNRSRVAPREGSVVRTMTAASCFSRRRRH